MERVLQGSVFHRHESRPFFSVQLDNRDCVMELVGRGKIAFGDIIQGQMDSVGLFTLKNLTTDSPVEVMIHHVQCSRVEALQRTTMI